MIWKKTQYRNVYVGKHMSLEDIDLRGCVRGIRA